jgi:hypothetical membrane protein
MSRLNRPRTLTYREGHVARWAVCSAIMPPVALVAGWLSAGLVQRGHYDPAQQTISVLAGHAASDRWIMTAALYLVGLGQILTSIGMSGGRPPARVVLAIGGVAGVGVALFPQPQHGSAVAHLVFATLSVSLLAIWPATMGAAGPTRPRVLTTRGSLAVTGVFLALLAWLYAAAHGGGALGIAERVDTAIECSWPLVVVLAIRRGTAPAARVGNSRLA